MARALHRLPAAWGGHARKLVCLLLAVFATVAAGGGAAGSVAVRHGGAVVVVDTRVKHQTMAGFGSSQRVFEDPHLSNASVTSVPESARRAIVTALYEELGLTRVRPVLDPGIEPVNDNRSPLVRNPVAFDFSGKATDLHVALVDRARRLGLRTVLPVPVTFEPWLSEANPDEYAEWALAVLSRWRALGTEPQFYSPVNEPGYLRTPRSAVWLQSVVRILGARLRAAGMRTRLVIPDDLNAREAYDRAAAVLADPVARRYVGALAYHMYGSHELDLDRMRELARRSGLPVWMTEFSDPSYRAWPGVLGWAETIHSVITRGGASAVDYMWGFFGDYSEGAGLVSIEFDRGVYQRHSFTPAYYVTGQFSRFVRPGYRRVAATRRIDDVLTSAFVNGRSQLVVVAVNTSDTATEVTFSVRGAGLRGNVAGTRTSATETWKRLEPLTARRNEFGMTLPGLSVTTFIARMPG